MKLEDLLREFLQTIQKDQEKLLTVLVVLAVLLLITGFTLDVSLFGVDKLKAVKRTIKKPFKKIRKYIRPKKSKKSKENESEMAEDESEMNDEDESEIKDEEDEDELTAMNKEAVPQWVAQSGLPEPNDNVLENLGVNGINDEIWTNTYGRV